MIAVVGGDRLSWQSQGPTPGRALEALKAAKGELIDLLVRYRLDSAGGLAGDDLLAALQVAGFAVRRYGFNAALDDALGGALHRVPEASLLYAFADKQAEYSLALRALRAPDSFKEEAASRAMNRSRSAPERRNRTEIILPPRGPESYSSSCALLASGPSLTGERTTLPTRAAGSAICPDPSRRR